MGVTGGTGGSATSALPPLDVTKLPLVLAGPIVRRVDETGVTVWLALKAPRKVTLDVYEGATGDLPATPAVTGTRVTARIGEHLHLVAVTARTASGMKLRPGTIHRYALRFGEDTTSAAPVPTSAPGLFTPGVIAATEAESRKKLLYSGIAGAPTLPSFITPPDKPERLRLFHASCRMPHADGMDALSLLDQVLATDAGSPERRPQQLLLTGDQIYADDVADGLLHICSTYGRTLLGRDEEFPSLPPATKWLFQPGRRQEMMTGDFHLTTEYGDSHLVRLAEFCAMYLLVWSETLWPDVPPIRFFSELFPRDAQALGDPDPTELFGLRTKESYKKAHERQMDYIAQCDRLDGFRTTLPEVRRALANTATYMVFDDHEITDDWFISSRWVDDVCGTAHGRRLIGNGLAAYAVFQAWGNTPEQFEDSAQGEAGRDLLAALAAPDHTAPGPAAVIARRTGVPTGTTGGRFNRQDGSLAWHYSVTCPAHRIAVLDTRTQRVFRGGPKDPPALLYADASYATMVEAVPDPGLDKVTLLISPCPILGHPLIEGVGQPLYRTIHGYKGQLVKDYEAWGHDERAFEKLMARLFAHAGPGPDGVRRRRVVALSGDVHYGFAGRLTYEADTPFSAAPGPVRGVLAQLTASSLKNQTADTELLHDHGFLQGFSLPHSDRAGWANPTGKWFPVSVTGPDLSGTALIASGTPAILDIPDGTDLVSQPEWRYRLDFYRHEDPDHVLPPSGAPIPIAYPATGDRRQAIAAYVAGAANHDGYRGRWGSGKEIVGRNNIGEIQFGWGSQDAKSVTQTLWWRLPGERTGAPLTRLTVPLEVGQSTGPAAEVLPDLYGGHPLREGDTDASTAGTGAAGVSAAPTHVSDLQRDLQELGFGVVRSRDGRFGRELRWAVRELQGYARMGRVARVATAVARLAAPLTATATELTVAAAPTDLPAVPFRARAGDENLTVTAVNATGWTIGRGADGTGAAAHPTGDAVTVLRDSRWSSALESVEVPLAQRFTGQVSGVADTETRRVIARWKANGWRCPVVVEAWELQSGNRHHIQVIPAAGGRPARLADNLWRWDDTTSTTSSSPRMYARDFSDHWTRPATRPADSWEPERCTAIGQRVPYNDPKAAAGDPARPMSGPVAMPERGQCWAPEAEITPERLLGRALRDLGPSTLATFKVLRAVAEVEALGYFDAVNCYDHAFASLGLCHWTFGTRVWHPANEANRPPRERWEVADGELWAFLAYLRSRDEAAFRQVAGDFGVLPDRVWTGNGQAGTPRPWDPAQRKYAARGTVTRQDGSSRPLHGHPDPGSGVTQAYGQYGDHEYFRLWHWFHRFVMAGRTSGGFQRAMWDMARMRVRDLRAAVWNTAPTTSNPHPNPFPLQAGTTVGDVFRSERTVALLHRWHVFSPAALLRGSPGRASNALQQVVATAQAASGLVFGTDPTAWTEAHEVALAAAILTRNACPKPSADGAQPHPAGHGNHTGAQDPGHTLRIVDTWPSWYGGSNPRQYTLPLDSLPEAQRTLRTARDFVLDTEGLPT